MRERGSAHAGVCEWMCCASESAEGGYDTDNGAASVGSYVMVDYW